MICIQLLELFKLKLVYKSKADADILFEEYQQRWKQPRITTCTAAT